MFSLCLKTDTLNTYVQYRNGEAPAFYLPLETYYTMIYLALTLVAYTQSIMNPAFLPDRPGKKTGLGPGQEA